MLQMINDHEIKARLPEKLKQAVAAASAAHFQTESEFIRQAVITRLKSVGLFCEPETITGIRRPWAMDPTVTINADEVSSGEALTNEQREFARQIFTAVMRRGFRQMTKHMDLDISHYEMAEATIAAWAELALGEEAMWQLN